MNIATMTTLLSNSCGPAAQLGRRNWTAQDLRVADTARRRSMKRTMFWSVSGFVVLSTLALSLGSAWAQTLGETIDTKGKAKLRLSGTGNFTNRVDV
jgi:hypothetical protein